MSVNTRERRNSFSSITTDITDIQGRLKGVKTN